MKIILNVAITLDLAVIKKLLLESPTRRLADCFGATTWIEKKVDK